jgi:hypothetical protein
LNKTRSEAEERKGPEQTGSFVDYMRDTFVNIAYKYKGGLDRKGLAKSLNSINDQSYFFSSEKQQKPVAYVLNEKFNPSNVRTSRYQDQQDSYNHYVNKLVSEIQEAVESITWFTYRAGID